VRLFFAHFILFREKKGFTFFCQILTKIGQYFMLYEAEAVIQLQEKPARTASAAGILMVQPAY
jgi:hypothetical protein